MRTAVVTDSTADLPPRLAADAGIRVVPLAVRFGDEERHVGVDLSTEQFWERMLARGTPIPTTAAPSPGDFRAVFEACFADGAEAIVCPVIGSRISATHASATVAAGSLEGREIHVIDTGSTSMATGFPALIAAELAAAGTPACDIADAVRARLPDINYFAAVDTLEYLRRGGRLSTPQAMIGTMLSLKPIITSRDGEIVMAERQRTRAKAREKVIDLIARAPVERLAVMSTPTSTPAEVADFREALLARIPGGVEPGRVIESLFGASTGPHLGPDLVGAVFVRPR